MKSTRRNFVRTAVVLGAALAAPLPGMAQTLGKDYNPISPAQPTEDAAKVEVLEFFSYGCPHCADFNPLVTAWAAKQGSDVVFKKVPITFGRGAWANISKLYYALEATGDLAKLDAEVFKAIHAERVNLFEERTLLEWVAKKGVDGKKFADAFNSFGVNSKVKRADQLAQAYKVQGVPAMAVDGKFMVADLSYSDKLLVADKLVAKARSEKSGKK